MDLIKEISQLIFILFILLTPISSLTYLIGTTGKFPIEERLDVAQKACLFALGIGVFFSLTGPALFSSLGVKLSAFKIFAGILLFINGFSLLKLKGNQHVTSEEKMKTLPKDIAITPLAFPLLTGPATIGQLVTHYEEMKSPFDHFVLCLAFSIAVLFSYLLFHLCLKHLNMLSIWALNAAERLTGLFAVTLAVQCVINGIHGYLNHL